MSIASNLQTPSFSDSLRENLSLALLSGLFAPFATPVITIIAFSKIYNSLRIATKDLQGTPIHQTTLNNLIGLQVCQISNTVGLLSLAVNLPSKLSTPLVKMALVSTIFIFVTTEVSKALILAQGNTSRAKHS